MFDLTNLPPCAKIEVMPNDNIFLELGNNTYDFKDLLSELIDNSVAARVEGEITKVSIDFISGKDSNIPKQIIFRDNAVWNT